MEPDFPLTARSIRLTTRPVNAKVNLSVPIPKTRNPSISSSRNVSVNVSQKVLTGKTKNDSGRKYVLSSLTEGKVSQVSTLPLSPKKNLSGPTSNTRDSSNCSKMISANERQKVFTKRTKIDSEKKHVLPSLTQEKEHITKNEYINLVGMKPSNFKREKDRFFKSNFMYNPQFDFGKPPLPSASVQHSQASNRFLQVAINIIQNTLKKYKNYENYEQVTGGNLLTTKQIYQQARKYMETEGCQGEIAVNITEDVVSQASMGTVKRQPTMTINVSMAREQWLQGTLRHEIGTHYFRTVNNSKQPWNNSKGREKYGLEPANPTEEGLATIHSLLFHPDPDLCRVALLYYTIYQASSMSFSELFEHLKIFVKDPDARWYYCVRAKRGQTDTSQPGCCNKDQVYLEGVLHILRHRHAIDFKLLMAMGKVSYLDVNRLKKVAMLSKPRIPNFLKDRNQYMMRLEKIMQVNKLTDTVLRKLVD
ncbi:putative tyrosine carboxypeptidase MATCAP2 [Pelobates fuscus]|uniref:putative tyrosine carboxypeptidase MATCAP2 n=1 Tax=Pelobates fuscus TaxID=191477 RepID=UPI002FE4ADF6